MAGMDRWKMVLGAGDEDRGQRTFHPHVGVSPAPSSTREQGRTHRTS